MALKTSGNSTEDKLDEIVEHLRRLDRRDRLRTVGGFFRSIIGFIPMIVFLLGIWYVYNNTDDILRSITQEAAKQAAEYTKEGFLKTFK
ncbi:hypothetical protein A2706_02055 [Candidatus Peribacteria bacterium RIFCSPHIGHO2_01_FULL_51_35]|nr:MAG: hypothetical protein A2706_02055 [Candidatus Peribacteria bacterium RIFCSPHIGHO2_01_FULL_51_35]